MVGHSEKDIVWTEGLAPGSISREVYEVQVQRNGFLPFLQTH